MQLRIHRSYTWELDCPDSEVRLGGKNPMKLVEHDKIQWAEDFSPTWYDLPVHVEEKPAPPCLEVAWQLGQQSFSATMGSTFIKKPDEPAVNLTGIIEQLRVENASLKHEIDALTDCLNGSSKATYTADVYDKAIAEAKEEARAATLVEICQYLTQYPALQKFVASLQTQAPVKYRHGVSTEVLSHFRCGKCDAWWTIADWQKITDSLTCPRCSTVATVAEFLPQ